MSFGYDTVFVARCHFFVLDWDKAILVDADELYIFIFDGAVQLDADIDKAECYIAFPYCVHDITCICIFCYFSQIEMILTKKDCPAI